MKIQYFLSFLNFGIFCILFSFNYVFSKTKCFFQKSQKPKLCLKRILKMSSTSSSSTARPKDGTDPRSLFFAADKNSDGNLAVHEVDSILAKYLDSTNDYAKRKALAQKLIDAVDTDSDGSVSFDEFEKAFKNLSEINEQSLVSSWIELAACGDTGSEFSASKPAPGQPFYMALIAGGVGGVVSRTATAPLDRVKIMMQTGTATSSTPSSSTNKGFTVSDKSENTFGVLRRIIKNEPGAFISLFKGNGAACLRVFPFAGIVCFSYGRILKNLTPADDELDIYEPLYRCASGALAASIASVATYPLDVVRAQMAVASENGANTAKPISLSQALINCSKQPYSQLFAGLRPTLIAVAPFVGVQQATYDCVKSAALGSGHFNPSFGLFLSCGCVAGLVAQTVVHPLDVIRRRAQIYNSSNAAAAKAPPVGNLFAGITPALLSFPYFIVNMPN